MPINQRAIRTITFALDASGRPVGAAINERPLRPTNCFLRARLLVVIPVYPTGQIGDKRTEVIDLDEPESDLDDLCEEMFATQPGSKPAMEIPLSQRQAAAMAAGL